MLKEKNMEEVSYGFLKAPFRYIAVDGKKTVSLTRQRFEAFQAYGLNFGCITVPCLRKWPAAILAGNRTVTGTDDILSSNLRGRI